MSPIKHAKNKKKKAIGRKKPRSKPNLSGGGGEVDPPPGDPGPGGGPK